MRYVELKILMDIEKKYFDVEYGIYFRSETGFLLFSPV